MSHSYTDNLLPVEKLLESQRDAPTGFVPTYADKPASRRASGPYRERLPIRDEAFTIAGQRLRIVHFWAAEDVAQALAVIDGIRQYADVQPNAARLITRDPELARLVADGVQHAARAFGDARLSVEREGDELVLVVEAVVFDDALAKRDSFVDEWWVPNAPALDGRLWLDLA